MTATTLQPRLDRPGAPTGRAGFGSVLHAEWTKFRTLHGWVIAVVIAAVLIDVFGLLAAGGMSIGCGQNLSGKACYRALPTGPGGQAVTDTFLFARQSLTGTGSITVRATSLTGHYTTGPAPAAGSAGDAQATGVDEPQPWSKVGIILKASLIQGSAYAAMANTGSHGTRMQWNYTHDVAGLPGTVSASSPRWLRLTRSGDDITGYDSTDGVTWTKVATAHLAGLPATVQIGLFAASPEHVEVTQFFGGSSGTGGPSTATGTFDHIRLTGTPAGAAWTASGVGDTGGPGQGQAPAARPGGPAPEPVDGTMAFRQTGVDQATVTGTGDIAPVVPGGPGATATIEDHLMGTFVGLLVLVVVAAMVGTAEYRRGLVRVTLAAVPRRGQVLAAKALVVAAVAFVAGLAAAAVAVPVGNRISRNQGAYLLPVSWLTEARVIVGTAALLAVCAVLAVAVGVILRRGAGAVAAVIVGIVLPYLLSVASVLPVSAAEWVLRVTPAAGFAIQQTVPRYAQVTSDYAPPTYFPLGPWAGFAVLCGWTVVALVGAHLLLRRRDA
jgi:ABC-type transport system involved in multi-copper enzyme maturation permease subunit